MELLSTNNLKVYDEFSKRLLDYQKEIVNLSNLNVCDYKIITVLYKNKDLNQTSLSYICGFDKPATSRLLCKLFLKGLIKKEKKNDDKKNSYISLTDKGNEIGKEIEKLSKDLFTKYFNSLNEEENRLFISLFNKILGKGEEKC